MANYSYNPQVTVVPYQKLALSKKTEEWRKNNVDAFIGKSYYGNTNDANRKYEMKIAYDLYNSVFDEKDFKYITDPYKVSEGFPASLQNFNIIKPKIDLLMGEESKRPFSFKVVQSNEEATSRVQNKYKELLMNTVMEVALDGNPNDPVTEKDIDRVEEISRYITRDFSDIAEQQAYHTLNYILEKEDLKTQFLMNFHDLMCGSMELAYVGQLNGEPVVERVNPLYFSFDYSPETRYIEDGDWAVRRMRMTPASVYDRFYDLMDEKDLDSLIEKFSYDGTRQRQGDKEGPYGIQWRNVAFETYDDFDSFTGDNIDVWHVTWKSLKKVGFVTYYDDEGEEIQEMVDETYKPTEGEEISWDWLPEVWEGYRIGDDIYVGIKPIPEQSISLDNPSDVKLPYVGLIFNANNTAPKSLIEIMKPLQYLYIAIMYQLQLAISRDKGKILTVDVTQIPKSLGIDANKWLHYLASTNINFINPYETGWDTPGREGGKPAQFNQFGQADLSMSNVIVQYIQLMDKIEDMIGELSGVSRQRQGQVQTSELVGNVQQTIIQSSHITEFMFYMHNQFKKRVMTQALNVAKNVWANSGKEKLHYITDDTTRIFMDITDDFIYSDMDIFISDSTRENQSVEYIKQLAQPAMQNGASFLDVAEILASNNLTDIKNKLERIEKQRKQREDDVMAQQQEAQMQATQAQAQIEQGRQALEQAKLAQAEAASIRQTDAQVEVALINAGSREAIEANKQDVDLTKAEMDLDAKMQDLNLQEKELEETRRSNISEEAIKRTAANKPTTTTNK